MFLLVKNAVPAGAQGRNRDHRPTTVGRWAFFADGGRACSFEIQKAPDGITGSATGEQQIALSTRARSMARRSVSRGSTTVEGTSTKQGRRTAERGRQGDHPAARCAGRTAVRAPPGGQGAVGTTATGRRTSCSTVSATSRGPAREPAATTGPDHQQIRIVRLFGQHLGGPAVGRHRSTGTPGAAPRTASIAVELRAVARLAPGTAVRDRSRCRYRSGPSQITARTERADPLRVGDAYSTAASAGRPRRRRPRPPRCARRAGHGPPPAGSRCGRPAAARWNRPAPRATRRDRGCR